MHLQKRCAVEKVAPPNVGGENSLEGTAVEGDWGSKEKAFYFGVSNHLKGETDP